MPKDLERDLGLVSTTTISIGAMVGSGIFVLPGLAAAKAGPAVILAYFLAGVVVLPAAISKAEMATAMPEAGGTYLYIDRAMGPLPGTIAGIGAWFSLVFKSAFALVGLGAYLLLLVEVPPGLLTVVGLGIALLLVAVNVVGVKQTGRLQATIVSVVLLSLVGFVADGSTYVDGDLYHPFFSHGGGGLLAATGFVFVSYAGVTKIASVAEEVENPGRTIPRAILGSVVLMMFLYTLTVFVIVGVTPPDSLHHNLTPMAAAAVQFAGETARLAVAGIAVLALTSMANAGILSSSRYPLAMSRDSLAPQRFSRINGRFKTPVAAIAFTGVVLLVLIAFVPVNELAKLASAFQIVVFGLINVALVAFRESSLDWYDPEFVAPGYPWVQLFGVVGTVVLLTQLGLIPLAGAVGIFVVGVGWYRLYGRDKTDREGAALDALRRSMGQQTLDRTERAVADSHENVLVVVGEDADPSRMRALVRMGASVVAKNDGTLRVAKIEAVPEQTTLSSMVESSEGDIAFEQRVTESLPSMETSVVVDELVTHNPRHAVVNVADEMDADAVFGELEPDYLQAELLGTGIDWYMNHAPCDVGFLQNRGLGDIATVTVLVEPGIFNAAKVSVATEIATHSDATLHFVTALANDASPELVAATEDFYGELEDVSSVPTEWELIRTDDRVGTLVDATSDSDLVVLGTIPHSTLYTLLFGHFSTDISDRIDASVLLFHPNESEGRPFLRKLLERVAFGTTESSS